MVKLEKKNIVIVTEYPYKVINKSIPLLYTFPNGWNFAHHSQIFIFVPLVFIF